MRFTCSIKSGAGFKRVYEGGKSRADACLVMYVLPNGLGVNRLGLTVSKKVGNAVVRNRVRRLIRENYRLRENAIHSGFDIVVVARPTAAGAGFVSLGGGLDRLLKKLRMVNGEC